MKEYYRDRSRPCNQEDSDQELARPASVSSCPQNKTLNNLDKSDRCNNTTPSNPCASLNQWAPRETRQQPGSRYPEQIPDLEGLSRLPERMMCWKKSILEVLRDDMESCTMERRLLKVCRSLTSWGDYLENQGPRAMECNQEQRCETPKEAAYSRRKLEDEPYIEKYDGNADCTCNCNKLLEIMMDACETMKKNCTKEKKVPCTKTQRGYQRDSDENLIPRETLEKSYSKVRLYREVGVNTDDDFIDRIRDESCQKKKSIDQYTYISEMNSGISVGTSLLESEHSDSSLDHYQRSSSNVKEILQPAEWNRNMEHLRESANLEKYKKKRLASGKDHPQTCLSWKSVSLKECVQELRTMSQTLNRRERPGYIISVQPRRAESCNEEESLKASKVASPNKEEEASTCRGIENRPSQTELEKRKLAEQFCDEIIKSAQDCVVEPKTCPVPVKNMETKKRLSSTIKKEPTKSIADVADLLEDSLVVQRRRMEKKSLNPDVDNEPKPREFSLRPSSSIKRKGERQEGSIARALEEEIVQPGQRISSHSARSYSRLLQPGPTKEIEEEPQRISRMVSVATKMSDQEMDLSELCSCDSLLSQQNEDCKWIINNLVRAFRRKKLLYRVHIQWLRYVRGKIEYRKSRTLNRKESCRRIHPKRCHYEDRQCCKMLMMAKRKHK